MRNFGGGLSLIGFALGIYAFFMDISVDVGDGSRVINIELMSRQQNLILIAGVLFIAGVIASRVRKKHTSTKPQDYMQVDKLSSDDFVSNLDGVISLNYKKVDELSLMFINKHQKSSSSDILLMESPRIERICRTLPSDIRKAFREDLERRIRENI